MRKGYLGTRHVASRLFATKKPDKHAAVSRKCGESAHVVGVVDVWVLGVQSDETVGRCFDRLKIHAQVVGVNEFQLPLFCVPTERETRFELLKSTDAKRIVPGLKAGIRPSIQDLFTGFILDYYLLISVWSHKWHPGAATKRGKDGEKN